MYYIYAHVRVYTSRNNLYIIIKYLFGAEGWHRLVLGQFNAGTRVILYYYNVRLALLFGF